MKVKIMYHPTWKSRKFSFQSFQLVILLTSIVTSHAGALRAKREVNIATGVSTASEHSQRAAITIPSSPMEKATESNFISMDTTELEEELATIADSEIAMDNDTQSLPPSLPELTNNSDAAVSTTMSIASQQTTVPNIINASDSAMTTVKYADVTPMLIMADTLPSTTSEKEADVMTTKTPTMPSTTTGRSSSTQILTTMASKPTTTDNSLPLTTLPQVSDLITTTMEAVITEKAEVSVIDDNQAIAVQPNETETANITTDSSVDLKTTTFIQQETTTEPVVGVNTNRLPTNMNEETTTFEHIPQTTFRSEDIDSGTSILNTDLLNEIQTTINSNFNTTDESNVETTTINDQQKVEFETTTEQYATTDGRTKELASDKNNYNVEINEIKQNGTITGLAPHHGAPEGRNKYIGEDMHLNEEVSSAATTTLRSSVATSTSLKTKTTKSHKFIDSPELIKTNDVESIPVTNHSFTGTGAAAANSIENTLEAGQLEDSVVNKIENRDTLPQIVDRKQAMKMINSTQSIGDILIPSTPSIERNRVEDLEDISLTTGYHRFDSNHIPLTTTERIQNSIPSSIIPLMSQENKTTIESHVDTTTKRFERSTSTSTATPTATAATTQKIVNVTTSTNITPLSVMPIERELESTTSTASDYEEQKSIVLTTTEQQHVVTDNKLITATSENAYFPETTSNILASDLVSTVESSESNAIITSTSGSNTIRIATTIASTTPLPSSKQPPTKARSKPQPVKETTTPAMNTTHIVSTEPIEEYSIQPRINQPNGSINLENFASPAPITTTEFPRTETTEKVTTAEPDNGTDYNVIIAISVSVVGIIALILLVGFLYVMRKRQKSISYGQRCRPVSLDAYSLDNVSIFNSVRRKGALRASKRSYGNAAFDDPSLKHNSMSIHELAKFVDRRMAIHEEFRDVPQIIARPDEVPPGCEDKNRYANVIPLPETRVILNRIGDDDKTEYINANYVQGPKDPANYYIACQAPLDSTVSDFWRMIWEQNSRVIIMATDLIENGVEKCAEYIPASMTLDNYVVYGDFQIILKSREVKEKYAVSTLHVKNISLNRWREIIHFWYKWPEMGVPTDEASVIAMLLEARSYLKMGTPEQSDEEMGKATFDANGSTGSLDKTKSLSKSQGPLTVHCSPGTGRTGTIIACDMALRSLEMPKRIIDIPQFVYYVRRGRASAVQTKEQYEFIYKVAHMYATKISGPINEN